jgi:hypothetical protein
MSGRDTLKPGRRRLALVIAGLTIGYLVRLMDWSGVAWYGYVVLASAGATACWLMLSDRTASMSTVSLQPTSVPKPKSEELSLTSSEAAIAPDECVITLLPEAQCPACGGPAYRTRPAQNRWSCAACKSTFLADKTRPWPAIVLSPEKADHPILRPGGADQPGSREEGSRT